MSNWKQKIEAQIADCRGYAENEYDALHDYADTMQALLDVAVAADTYLADHHNDSEQALFDALDKLREVDDGANT